MALNVVIDRLQSSAPSNEALVKAGRTSSVTLNQAEIYGLTSRALRLDNTATGALVRVFVSTGATEESRPPFLVNADGANLRLAGVTVEGAARLFLEHLNRGSVVSLGMSGGTFRVVGSQLDVGLLHLVDTTLELDEQTSFTGSNMILDNSSVSVRDSAMKFTNLRASLGARSIEAIRSRLNLMHADVDAELSTVKKSAVLIEDRASLRLDRFRIGGSRQIGIELVNATATSSMSNGTIEDHDIGIALQSPAVDVRDLLISVDFRNVKEPVDLR